MQNLIGRIANSLHWQTREDVIRNELLYREGDTYNQALIEESERILRSLGFIGDVTTRIENTKQQGAGTIRIDLAYNFDRKQYTGLIISGSVPFSAFQYIGFTPPTNVGRF